MHDPELHDLLVQSFADAAMRVAGLRRARRTDVEDAPRFSAAQNQIVCVCGITGCTYTAEWDGTEASAVSFAGDAGRASAELITGSRHYDWLRSGR